MSRRQTAFTESDVKRAIKAITAAGQPVAGVRFHDDGFTVLIGEPIHQSNSSNSNPWDEVFTDAKNEKRPA
jgi:hypothetical protein